MLVVRELMLGPRRFSDLRASLPGISAKVLTERLTALEDAGVVVKRKVTDPVPAHLYELTEWGYRAEPAIQELGRWAAMSSGHDPLLPLSVSRSRVKASWPGLPTARCRSGAAIPARQMRSFARRWLLFLPACSMPECRQKSSSGMPGSLSKAIGTQPCALPGFSNCRTSSPSAGGKPSAGSCPRPTLQHAREGRQCRDATARAWSGRSSAAWQPPRPRAASAPPAECPAAAG